MKELGQALLNGLFFLWNVSQFNIIGSSTHPPPFLLNAAVYLVKVLWH